MTIYQMREEIANLRAEVTQVDNWISDNASRPETPIAEIQNRQSRLQELNDRIAAMSATLQRAEAAQRASLEQQAAEPAKQQRSAPAALHGALYRAVAFQDTDARRQVMNSLGAIPDSASGANYLPTQLMTDLIHEPFDDNPIRRVCRVTNITGYEEPKISFTVDDDDFVNDGEVAKEMELNGGKVSYGRYKTKVKAVISDTVLNGSDIDLGAYVDNSLRSGLATKEKKCMFDAAADEGRAHMSFYSTANAIKSVTGSTLLQAILNAYGDLNDAFAGKACVAMRRADYVAMITDMANGSDTLWGRKPEDVIGIPVLFVDKATTPVVGDFSYLGINYDIGTTLDSDKDVDTGDTKFVLTAWFDIQIKLKSAFRLAKKSA